VDHLYPLAIDFPLVATGEAMILSPSQIAQYAAAAGFSGADLATGVAIAIAESGGDPSVIGDKTLAPTNGPSYGLWQINVGSKANPQYAGANLLDPQTNANAAHDLYSRKGFLPWTTYISGEYGMYETPAVMAAAGQSPNAPLPGASSPLILDAATGQPIVDAAPMYAALDPSLLAPSTSPSFSQVLLWGLLGVAALWIFSEVT
jgi:hypothetical protein